MPETTKRTPITTAIMVAAAATKTDPRLALRTSVGVTAFGIARMAGKRRLMGLQRREGEGQTGK
jgi:hypothetical protein